MTVGSSVIRDSCCGGLWGACGVLHHREEVVFLHAIRERITARGQRDNPHYLMHKIKNIASLIDTCQVHGNYPQLPLRDGNDAGNFRSELSRITPSDYLMVDMVRQMM